MVMTHNLHTTLLHQATILVKNEPALLTITLIIRFTLQKKSKKHRHEKREEGEDGLDRNSSIVKGDGTEAAAAKQSKPIIEEGKTFSHESLEANWLFIQNKKSMKTAENSKKEMQLTVKNIVKKKEKMTKRNKGEMAFIMEREPLNCYK